MNILRTYKRTLSFLWINIIGLSIGLATAIILILFTVNELSYDKHFANAGRIVKLSTVYNGQNFDINRRQAYSEVPGRVPGVESALQIYRGYDVEVKTPADERYQDINLLYTENEFFEVFQTTFIDGNPQTALSDYNSVVITEKIAIMIFGDVGEAVGKTIILRNEEYIVTSVVSSFPSNSHFTFDILIKIKEEITRDGGLEFITYYLISKDSDVDEVCGMIKKEYNRSLEDFFKYHKEKTYSYTEKLADIYLHTQSDAAILGTRGSMTFVWALSAIALSIMLLAIAGFVNLFIAQCETRLKEIGVRKINGAGRFEITKMFMAEIAVIVFVAFIAGCFLAVLFTPYFAILVEKEIELIQITNPLFIVSILFLYTITVLITAIYPSLYVSHFGPLDILGKRLKLTKKNLTFTVVVFQSVITIVFIGFVLVMNQQTKYLADRPAGYNPKNILKIYPNTILTKNIPAIREELSAIPQIKGTSGASHTVGISGSGQTISKLTEREVEWSIDEYRIMPGLCEMFEFELIEGEFFKQDYSEETQPIILNEAAVRMLELEYPVAGQYIYYKGVRTQITGVIKDFYFNEINRNIRPLAFRNNGGIGNLYVRFDEKLSRTEAEKLLLSVLHKFDKGFVLKPDWSEDIIAGRFKKINDQSTIIFISSLLSLLIAMMGLVAIHTYTMSRRMKEIAIRKVNGAEAKQIYTVLSAVIIKWILFAGIIAAPILYFVATGWLNYYENRVSLNVWIFIIPVLIQLIIAVLITSGVTLKAVTRNPVESLKTE